MLTFNKTYFILSIFLFMIEVLIAVFAHDEIIRPYVGDLLVVVLLYCLVKSFLSWSVISTAVWVLLFSYLIETLQFFNIVRHLGLSSSKIANIIIGNYFTWIDILAYTLGILLVLGIENFSFSRVKVQQEDKVWLFL